METLFFALSPVAVALITTGIKELKAWKSFTNGGRKATLRFIVAALSFGAIVGGALLSGGEVEAMSVEVFVEAGMVFLSSTGLYFFTKKKKPKVAAN